jgi:23S rRNA (adenine2503-C2)-methyltransferase
MNLLDLDKSGLESLMAELGQPGYRAGQIFDWLHKKRATSLDEMTNLPAALRQKLAGMAHVGKLEVLRHQQAGDGTVKLLLELKDGETVETVFMVHRHGNSLCISTQVGCRMGCAFCASTLSGLARNLTPGEMLAQVYAAEAFTGKPVQSIVLMGMGEPLDNLDNVLAFLRLLSHPDGFGMSLRHVSLSTCGVVPGIRELARHKLGLTLSVSLHAADDETRGALMPINRKYPIAELLAACDDYFEATGRRISYEYALIAGVNDDAAHAHALCRLLGGRGCHVNLIPINRVEEGGFSRSDRVRIQQFCAILNKNQLTATVRRELGGDIDAACGQLRRRNRREQGRD